MRMCPRFPRPPRGFTLVELLAVIIIIALLASLLMPVLGSALERANMTTCLGNLRAIAVSARIAAQDNNNVFPLIESDPTNPVYGPEDNAKPLLQTLQRYNLSERSLQCPTDLKRGAASDYKLRGSSYFWYPYADDSDADNVQIYTPRGVFMRQPARVQLAADWTAIHPVSSTPGAPMRFNVVYADGHTVDATTVFKPR